MRLRTMRTCVKDGFRGIFRNGLMSLASIGTIAACLIILGITYCLVVNVQHFADNLDGNLGMVAFLKAGVTEQEVADLQKKLNDRQDIREFTYISAEQAWKEFQQEMIGGDEIGEDLMGELVKDNPLQNSANIEIYPLRAEDQEAIVSFLNQEPAVQIGRAHV